MKLTKRITVLFLTMVILLSGAVGVAAEELYTLSDVTNVLKYTAGWGDEYYKLSYDYNCDGTVNIHDATCILKMIAGWDEYIICLETPSDELIHQIEVDYDVYYNRKPDSDPVYVKYYYGTYNGAVAVKIHGPFSYSDVEMFEEVAGSVFYYPYTNFIKIWKDGEFFSVNEAYEKGYLTKNDVAVIARSYTSGASIKYPTPDCYLPPK